jgi:hypothetical protein
MRKERIEAAQPIAAEINAVEVSLNHSLLHIGNLIANISKARLAPGTHFPLDICVEASHKLSAALVTTLSAYEQIVEVHTVLAQDRANMGLETVNFGHTGCPPLAREETVYQPLKLVNG